MNSFIQAVCTLIFIISLCTTKNALSDNLHSGSTSIQKSICYVTSSNKSIFLPSLKGDYLVYGYRMAIEDHFKISGRKYKLKEFISEDTTASLLTALKSASQTDCLLIVGLFTSYEALIAGSFLEKEKISGFSPVATHNDINKYFPYFRTGMASASTYIDAMTNFVLKSKKNKAILFSNNDDVYSSFFADELKNNISDFLSVNHLIVPRGSRLSNQQVKNIILDDKTILIFTMYSLASAPLLDQIRDIPYKKNMANFTILGSPAWAFETEAVVGPKTMLRGLPTSYAFGPWNPNSSREKTKLFTSRFNSKFGTSPRADVVYSYDTLTLALPCLDNSSTRDEATKCLAKPMSLDGVAGRLEFDGTHSHSKRAPILFSFHNGKMEVLE